MNKGFTMLEMLIAMALSAVVFMLVGSILAVFVTQNTRSLRQETFDQAKNDLAMELTNDVKWANSVTYGLGFMQTDSTELRVDNGKLLKNGINLLPERINITRFEISDHSGAAGLVSLEINMEFADRSFPVAQDGLHLIVSQRKTDISF